MNRKLNLSLPITSLLLFIKLAIEEDDQTFCINLLEETGVLLVPGSAFDLPKHARLGYCCKRNLGKGLFLLSEFLKNRPKQKHCKDSL